ncbi:MAG: hypothetical protein H8J66_15160 [Nitrospira sp.]|nr:hypothetical protein [Nitrospira sp.]
MRSGDLMKPDCGIGLLIGLLLTGSLVSGGQPTWQEQQNLPEWTAPVLAGKAFASTYALSTRLNPFFLHGDFNGDGRLDVAVLIMHKRTGQQGIAILHAGAQTAIVLGAGHAVGNGGADFSWLDAWSIFDTQTVQQGATGKKPPMRRGDALLVQKLESASALLYWDGTAYRWYQQGD